MTRPLAVLTLTTFAPAMLLGAAQGRELPQFTRWALGGFGALALGMAIGELAKPERDEAPRRLAP